MLWSLSPRTTTLSYNRGPGAAFFASGEKKPNSKLVLTRACPELVEWVNGLVFRISYFKLPDNSLCNSILSSIVCILASVIWRPSSGVRHLSSVFCFLFSVFCFLSFVIYICREPSTNQLLIMQNKPNFQDVQMNVNAYNTKNYENKSNRTLGQNKPKQTQFQTWFSNLLQYVMLCMLRHNFRFLWSASRGYHLRCSANLPTLTSRKK